MRPKGRRRVEWLSDRSDGFYIYCFLSSFFQDASLFRDTDSISTAQEIFYMYQSREIICLSFWKERRGFLELKCLFRNFYIFQLVQFWSIDIFIERVDLSAASSARLSGTVRGWIAAGRRWTAGRFSGSSGGSAELSLRHGRACQTI